MYVSREALMSVLLSTLREELAEKTEKERTLLAEVIIDGLDGTVIDIVDDDEAEESEESPEDFYEMPE